MNEIDVTERLRRLPPAVRPDPDFEAALRRRLASELSGQRRDELLRLVPSEGDVGDQDRPSAWFARSAAAAVVVAVALALVATIRSDDDVAPAEPADSLPAPVTPTTAVAPTTLPEPTLAESVEPVVDTIAVETGSNVYRVAAHEDHLWAMSLAGDLARIDAETRAVTGTLKLPDSGDIVAGPGALWFADALDGQVLRIDPDTLEVTGRIRTGIELVPEVWRPLGVAMYAGERRTFAAIGGIAVDETSVWVGSHDRVVTEFDSTTLDRVGRIEVGVRPDIVRITADHVLVAAYRGDVEIRRRLDGGLLHRIDDVEALLGAALGELAAYAHDLSSGSVLRVDLATGEVIRNESLDPPPVFEGLPVYSAGPALAADVLFVDVAGGVALLEPHSLDLIETIELAGRGGDATVTPDGAGLIARYTDRSISRIVPAQVG